jgi:hypothetical protein
MARLVFSALGMFSRQPLPTEWSDVRVAAGTVEKHRKTWTARSLSTARAAKQMVDNRLYTAVLTVRKRTGQSTRPQFVPSLASQVSLSQPFK